VIPVALVVSGCATVVHGTSQAIPFSSNPEGAEVFVKRKRERDNSYDRDTSA
jgi:hypothetical protein